MRTKILSTFIVLLSTLIAVSILWMSVFTVDAASKGEVTLCHKPNKQCQTKNVPESAVAGHIGHGDYLGECKCSPPVPSNTDTPTSTDTPNSTETPIDPLETQPADYPNQGDGSDIAAVTWMSTSIYHNTDGSIVIKWVGDAGHFRLCKKVLFRNMPCWDDLPVPKDAVAINLTEHRGTLVLGDRFEPGTYFLYAHHWLSGNTGNDNTQRNRLKIER